MVARPRDERDLDEVIAATVARNTAITPLGGLTSTTGAPLAPYGLALDTRGLRGLVDLRPHPARDDARIAVVRPGTNLADLQAHLSAEGWLYPPDPTSAPDCTIGGSVACNASGPRSFAYGATRNWVAGIELLDGNGNTTWLRRDFADKHALGFAFAANPLHLVVGSEGTLGVLRTLELLLIRPPQQVIGVWCGFDNLAAALTWLAAARRATPRPLALEGFDNAALTLVRAAPGGSALAGTDHAAIYAELAPARDADAPTWLSAWLDNVAVDGGGEPTATRVLAAPSQHDAWSRLRHAVPTAMNAYGAAVAPQGGRKVSTDWAVPPARLAQMFTAVDTALASAELAHLPHVRYGHWGNGHPHHNWIAPDSDALAKLLLVVRSLSDRAVALGGCFAAEHGIGKLKAAYWRRSLPAPLLNAAQAVKRAFDPRGLMAPGNFWG